MNDKLNSNIRKPSRYKVVVNVVIMIALFFSITVGNALTIPDLSAMLYQYQYYGSENGMNIIHDPVEGRNETEALKMNIRGNGEFFNAYCIDLQHGVREFNKWQDNKVYRMAPVDGTLNPLLSSDEVDKIRAILYCYLIAYGNAQHKDVDANKLKNAIDTAFPSDKVEDGIVFKGLSNKSIITGIQAALWNFIGDNVSVQNGNSSGLQYRDERNARRIFNYLKNLSPMRIDELATPAASIENITANSYISGTNNVNVKVNYTLSATAKGNPQGAPISWVLSIYDGTSPITPTVTFQDGDAGLIADGTQHSFVIENIADTTNLKVNFSGRQFKGYQIYGLADDKGGTILGQAMIVYDLFEEYGDPSKTVESNLNLFRGSLSVKKILQDGFKTSTTFPITVSGPNGFSWTANIAGDGTAVQVGSAGQLRYGQYTVTEGTAIANGFKIIDGSEAVVLSQENPMASVTIQNEKLGSVKVEKDVWGKEDDSTTFPVSLYKDDQFIKTLYVSESASGSVTFDLLEAGAYTVKEDLSAVAYAKYSQITDAGKPAEYTIQLASGQDTIVVFYNEYLNPDMAITKDVALKPSTNDVVAIDSTGGTSLVHAKPGDTLIYTIKVENTGNMPLTNVTFTDSLPGVDLSSMNIDELTLDGVDTFTYEYTVPEGTPPGVLTNTITATCTELNGETVSDDAMVNIVADPRLTVVKAVSSVYALPGETLDYSAIIYNNGNIPIVDIAYNDAMTGVSGPIETLGAGMQSAELDLGTYTVDSLEACLLNNVQRVINTVDVIGYAYDLAEDNGEGDDGGVITEPTQLTASSVVTTNMLVPGVELIKDVSTRYALENEQVAFMFTVKNNGETLLKDVTITDPMLGSELKMPSEEVLEPGETWTFEDQWVNVSDIMTNMDANRNIVNTATVTATAYREGNNDYTLSVADTDTAQFNVLRPELNVEKFVIGSDGNWYSSTTALEGEKVQFVIIVENVSQVYEDKGYIFTDIIVNDELLGQSINLGTLEPGDVYFLLSQPESPAATSINDESPELPYVLNSYTVDRADAADSIITNTATATATAIGSKAGTLTDSDMATIMLPSIAITKTANVQTIVPGGTITYTFTVTNTGSVPLYNPHITDNMLSSEPIALPVLQPRDTVEIKREYRTTSTFTGNLVNTAAVTAVTENAKAVSAEASASVLVYIPTNPSEPVPNVTLNVVIEGQGSVLPGSGSHSRSLGSLSIFSGIQPVEGWQFVGWFGANGQEVNNNSILMNGDKTVVARFAPITDEPETIENNEVPQSAPETSPEPSSEPTAEPSSTPVTTDQGSPDNTNQPTGDETIVLDQALPQGAPLPKTGGVPLELILSTGAVLTTAGVVIRRRKKEDK